MPAKPERTRNRPLRRSAAGDGARAIVLDVLDAVLSEKGASAEEAFRAHPALARLDARDRAFARMLYATVLRRLGEIDGALAAHLRRPPSRITVRNLLRMGAAQLLFLRTAAHAAVGETVALAHVRAPHHTALVNAVLRRIAAAPPPPLPPSEAARRNTPDWLWESWCRAHGEATTVRIALAHLQEPPLDLRARNDPAGWAERLGGEMLPGGTIRCRHAGAVELLPGYTEGAFWVQDVAAALPARLLGAVAGHRVLDLCAAPGGKTAQLCSAGARVTAVERSPERAERLFENLRRLRLEARIEVADALRWRPAKPFSHVLLDAPCSATGTIRRHPDIPWTKGAADIRRMAARQSELLDAAWAMVAPGGRLVYVVCSLQPEEGPEVIARWLENHPEAEMDPVDPRELADLPAVLSERGEVRTLPCHLAQKGGMDGFYIARLTRRQGS